MPNPPGVPGSPVGAMPGPTVGAGTGAGKRFKLALAVGATLPVKRFGLASLAFAGWFSVLPERNAGVVQRRAAIIGIAISSARIAYLGDLLLMFITPVALVKQHPELRHLAW